MSDKELAMQSVEDRVDKVIARGTHFIAELKTRAQQGEDAQARIDDYRGEMQQLRDEIKKTSLLGPFSPRVRQALAKLDVQEDSTTDAYVGMMSDVSKYYFGKLQNDWLAAISKDFDSKALANLIDTLRGRLAILESGLASLLQDIRRFASNKDLLVDAEEGVDFQKDLKDIAIEHSKHWQKEYRQLITDLESAKKKLSEDFQKAIRDKKIG